MLLGTQDRDFFPQNLKEKLAFVKKIGFDCFEIDGSLLLNDFDTVKNAVKESDIKVVSACGGYRGWIGDFIEERRLNAVEDLKKIICRLEQIGATSVVVPAAWGMFTHRLPPMVSPRTTQGDTAAIINSLKELECCAKKHNIVICLEPLNRYQDHMINTLQDGVSIIKEGNFEMVKLTCDFYHMSIEEDDISKALEQHKDYVAHVHIAENHRYQPGSGSIDFKRHIETLKIIGYTGNIVNEGRIRGANPLEEYIKSISYVKQFM